MKPFAVQSVGGTISSITREVIKAASSLGYVFSKIEFMDSIQVGSNNFYRYRLSCKEPTNHLLDELLSRGLGVIGPKGENFEVRLVGGNKGLAPTSTMLSAPRESKILRGTKDPHWERQFV
jgi:hypothetical protein